VVGKKFVWLNEPCVHELSVARWHDVHVVGKPLAAWLGFFVLL
jgi:hypothetical protein